MIAPARYSPTASAPAWASTAIDVDPELTSSGRRDHPVQAGHDPEHRHRGPHHVGPTGVA